jgi:hypothetical protein
MNNINNQNKQDIYDYNAIIVNIKGRTEYNKDKLDIFLIKYPDWKNFILKRHHKFLEYYELNNNDIKKLAEKFDYTPIQMAMILLRIQSQFEIYDNDKNFKGFSDLDSISYKGRFLK